MKLINRLISLFAVSTIAMIIACGGAGGGGSGSGSGGGSSSISGTAAAGAPIIGTATIKDSLGAVRGPVTIAADGSYSIDVSGMTGPFMVRVDGHVGAKEYHLYSGATSADVGGTINVTPLTDLILANIAHDVAANYYSSAGFASMTVTELNAARDALQDKLAPILTAMGVSTSIDLLRTSFDTDHTGIDAVMDILSITVDPATVKATITNIVNGDCVNVDIATAAYTNNFTGAGMSGSTVTDAQAIQAWLTTFSSLFESGLPPLDSTLTDLFDMTGFIMGGKDATTFLTEVTTDNKNEGLAFSNLSSVAVNYLDNSSNPGEGDTAQVTFDVTAPSWGKVETISWYFIRKSGLWVAQGDLRIVELDIKAVAEYREFEYPSAVIYTGICFYIGIDTPAAANVESAKVSGPGLSGEITLSKIITSNHLAINGRSSYSEWYNSHDDGLTDVAIGAIPDNAVYTIKLYNASNVLLHTYTEKLAKRPLAMSELSVASFPSFTAQTLTDLRVFNSGNLAAAWSKPSGTSSKYLCLELNGASNYDRVSKDLLSADTSATLTWPGGFSLLYRYLGITVVDSYKREYRITVW